MNVFFGESRDQILTDDAVEGPTLVTSGHLLSHRGQETLRVEEPGHPENLKKKTIQLVSEVSRLNQIQGK